MDNDQEKWFFASYKKQFILPLTHFGPMSSTSLKTVYHEKYKILFGCLLTTKDVFNSDLKKTI